MGAPLGAGASGDVFAATWVRPGACTERWAGAVRSARQPLAWQAGSAGEQRRRALK